MYSRTWDLYKSRALFYHKFLFNANRGHFDLTFLGLRDILKCKIGSGKVVHVWLVGVRGER